MDETRNYLADRINKKNWIREKHKNVYKVLNYIEHVLDLVSVNTGCVLISSFVSLVGISDEYCESCKRIKNLCNNCRK